MRRVFTVLNAALLLGLAIFGSGCCTGMLWEHSKRGKTSDTLVASALYQSNKDQSLAIEGTLYKQSTWGPGAGEKPRYLILPYKPAKTESTAQRESRSRVPREDLWTNLPRRTGLGWGRDVASAWPRIKKDAKLQSDLPPDYEKVFDLPKSFAPSLEIDGTTRYPNAGWMALAPVTVACDIATLPFQLLIGAMYVLGGPRC